MPKENPSVTHVRSLLACSCCCGVGTRSSRGGGDGSTCCNCSSKRYLCVLNVVWSCIVVVSIIVVYSAVIHTIRAAPRFKAIMIQGEIVQVLDYAPAAAHTPMLRKPIDVVAATHEQETAHAAVTATTASTRESTTTTVAATTTATASSTAAAKETTKTAAITPKNTHQAVQGEAAILLSANKPVVADVRGNLGDASVTTNEAIADWLKDRWQCAKNMNGEPIPGEHWLEVDLERECLVTSALIDWEDAYSDNYVLEGKKSQEENTWTLLASSRELKLAKRSAKHIEHKLTLKKAFASTPVRHVRLRIISGSTRWGSSVWRLQIWGHTL